MKYLLDTSICIYYMKGLYNLNIIIDKIGGENCYISEITVAELKFGVANSENKSKNKMILVTNNTRHFQRIKRIKIEDWTKL